MRKSLLCATIVFIAIILIFSLFLTGCEESTVSTDVVSNTSNTESADLEKQLILVDKFYIENTFNNLFVYILYDKDTKIMYQYIDTSNSGGLSVMYNADGTLKKYNP